MKRKKGISLIVLIITILVVIILAAVVILTLSKNNPIESAKEARFKEDVRTFQDELALFISKQYTNAGGHWDGNISAKTCDEIINYIPSFTKKYEGKFIINNNNLEYTNKLDENEKEYAQNLNVKEKVLKLLPDEYQQVEYIESTGTQYINTEVYPKSTIKVIFVFSYTGVNDMHYSANGWGSSGSQESFMWGYNTDLLFYSSISSHWINSVSNVELDNFKHTFILESGNQQLDNNIYGTTQIGDTATQTQYMYLFAVNAEWLSGKPYVASKEKVYNCEIYDNNILIRKFIPCYCKTGVTDINNKHCPEGTKGLYDTVEGKFYTNQGTGEFIAGPGV